MRANRIYAVFCYKYTVKQNFTGSRRQQHHLRSATNEASMHCVVAKEPDCQAALLYICSKTLHIFVSLLSLRCKPCFCRAVVMAVYFATSGVGKWNMSRNWHSHYEDLLSSRLFTSPNGHSVSCSVLAACVIIRRRGSSPAKGKDRSNHQFSFFILRMFYQWCALSVLGKLEWEGGWILHRTPRGTLQ